MNADSLYDITIATPRLELRVPTDADLDALARVLADGIQAAGQPHFMGEELYGASAEEHRRRLARSLQTSAHEWNAEDWHIPFAVLYVGQAIGLVTLFSRQFPITRGFGCSYWLGLAHHNRGIGTEAFRAALAFGFEGLHAREAYAGAYADNGPSLHLMEKLGFVYNGEYWMARQGQAIKDRRMRLPRERWTTPDDVVLSGVEACQQLFTGEQGVMY